MSPPRARLECDSLWIPELPWRYSAHPLWQARNPFAISVDSPQRSSAKIRRAFRARDGQAMLNILADLRFCQRVQVIADGDPLAKLPQLMRVQPVAQFGLAHQHNL